MLDKFFSVSVKCIVVFLSGLMLCACLSDIAEDSFTTTQANRLLSSDDSKRWRLLSRSLDGVDTEVSECETDLLLIFSSSEFGEEDQSTIVTLNSRTSACDQVGFYTVIYEAEYELEADVREAFINEITLTEESDLEIGSMTVLFLTSNFLTVSYQLDGVDVLEEYTF